MTAVTWVDLVITTVFAFCIGKVKWDLDKAKKEIERLKRRDDE